MPTTSGAFDGLIPSATPASSPASVADQRSSSWSARSVKYAAAAPATIDGKSDMAVRPSPCGSKSSVYAWW